jgi:hypothetical protein
VLEHEEPHRITPKSIRKYALALSLLLVVAGLLLNVVTIFWMIPSYELPRNMALWYVSIVVLFFAVIVGLLGLLAED